MINLKETLKTGDRTLGSWITIGDPIIADIMSQHFDWLVIDMEHSSITLDKAQDLIRIISLRGCVPIVRVGENNSYIIKRVLDAGALGIIVPMVNSKEDVQKAIDATYYPPTGKRGVGLACAQNYGENFESYKKWLEKECVIIAQIEHINGVRNLHEILKTNIDGIIVGPYDLSGSLGHPGDFNSPLYLSTLTSIITEAEKSKKALGIHVIPPFAFQVNELDPRYKFIAFSLDTLLLSQKIKGELDDINL